MFLWQLVLRLRTRGTNRSPIGDEALTAYSMQFTDMSQVRAVDQDMLARTRTWLLPAAAVRTIV